MGHARRAHDARLVDLVTAATRTLEQAGLPAGEARVDAQVLARWCLAWDAATWLARSIEPATEDFRERLAAAVDRRARRHPVSHITGRREFYGRPFVVGPDVLTPRPETELVVECALALIPREDGGSGRRVSVADVGTGCGCLAITIALERPLAEVLATDISETALGVARRNAARLAASARVRFDCADLLGDAAGPFDLVVANPPYVAERDADALSPEVRHEPAAALFAGPDGLAVIERLLPTAARVLSPGGHVVMEFGDGQAPVVERAVRRAGLELVCISVDLAGRPRVVVARRSDAGPR